MGDPIFLFQSCPYHSTVFLLTYKFSHFIFSLLKNEFLDKIMTDTEVTKKFKELLFEHFGDLVEKIILFGFRSRGKAMPDSDYDLLVVLKTDYDWELKNRILDACYELDVQYDLLTDIKLSTLADLNSIKGKQPFIINAMAEGLSV